MRLTDPPFPLESRTRTTAKDTNHSTILAIPVLQAGQGRGREQNYPKQVSRNHCSGKDGEHFEEQLSVSVDMELEEIESAKKQSAQSNP